MAIEDDVRTWTLPELLAARSILNEQIASEGYMPKFTASYDEDDLRERSRSQRSTFEGDPDPEFGTASLDSVELDGWGDSEKRENNRRMAGWRRRQLIHEGKLSKIAEPDTANGAPESGYYTAGRDGEHDRGLGPWCNCSACVARRLESYGRAATKAANLSRNDGRDHEGRALNSEREERRRFYEHANDFELEAAAAVNRRIREKDDISEGDLCIGFPGCPADHESMDPETYRIHVEGR